MKILIILLLCGDVLGPIRGTSFQSTKCWNKSRRSTSGETKYSIAQVSKVRNPMLI